MLQLSTLINAVSQASPVVFALAVLRLALWWRNTQRLELAQTIRPERLVWELLPPANAPPGSAGGSS